MAARLLAAGHDVVGYDPNPQAVATLISLGGRAAESAKAVADTASIVFSSLPTVAVFRQVGMGEDGLIAGKAVKVVIDLSTIGSEACMEVAAALASKGIAMVDAPVSGGAMGASAGTLAVMIAGDPKVVEPLMPLFNIFGKTFVVGDRPGQGQLMKLLNNMMSSTALAVTAEAYVTGMRAGLDPEVMLNVFNAGSARNSATSDKFPKYVLTRSFDFGFSISSVCKDIGLAIHECEARGVPTWVGGQASQLWHAVSLQKGGALDMTALVAVMEEWSGKTTNSRPS